MRLRLSEPASMQGCVEPVLRRGEFVGPRTLPLFRTLRVAALAKTLRQIAGHLKLPRYRKHPRGPKKPPPPKSAYVNGGHVSTFKLLNRNE